MAGAQDLSPPSPALASRPQEGEHGPARGYSQASQGTDAPTQGPRGHRRQVTESWDNGGEGAGGRPRPALAFHCRDRAQSQGVREDIRVLVGCAGGGRTHRGAERAGRAGAGRRDSFPPGTPLPLPSPCPCAQGTSQLKASGKQDSARAGGLAPGSQPAAGPRGPWERPSPGLVALSSSPSPLGRGQLPPPAPASRERPPSELPPVWDLSAGAQAKRRGCHTRGMTCFLL